MKHRLQLDFPSEGIRELDEMKQMVGAESRAQLIRFALKLLQWYLGVRQKGGSLLVEMDGRQERIVFPFIEVRHDVSASKVESVLVER